MTTEERMAKRYEKRRFVSVVDSICALTFSILHEIGKQLVNKRLKTAEKQPKCKAQDSLFSVIEQ